MTTNWDTLLERAAQQISEINYEPVLVAEDIARAKPPRIVKLHGTLPSGPFVFAEEDYRNYPVRYAPFVNLARQVFLENELCLLGFSGSDPNFLQWSGWVRDHLGESARRIYLAGVLNLPPATRRLLERRNVAPIDLAPLVDRTEGPEKHFEAVKLLLDHFHEAKPKPAYDWQPWKDPNVQNITPDDFTRRHTDKEYGAQLLDAAAEHWQADREQYPGWLICPEEKRRLIRHATDDVPLPHREHLAHLRPERRLRVLYELAWRFDKAFWPIPPFLLPILQEAATPSQKSGLSLNEHLDLAIISLRMARQTREESCFEDIAQIISAHSASGSDHRAALAYQRCLRFRDRLEIAELLKELADVEGSDPVWKLRQSALLCEVGEFDRAEGLVTNCLSDLRQRQRRDRASLWVLSRRAWAQFLARAAAMGIFRGATGHNFSWNKEWPLEFKAAKCDPWDELNVVENEINSVVREQADADFGVKVHFEPGVYSEENSGIRIRSWTQVPPAKSLDRLVEDAGVPVDFGYVDIRRSYSKNALALAFEQTATWYCRLLSTVNSHTDEFMDRYLGRIPVARMPNDVVSTLTDRVASSIAFWRSRTRRFETDSGGERFDIHAIERIRLRVEAASRLVIRANPIEAKRFYDLAISMIGDSGLRHWWLLEPIDHLFQWSIEAIPPDERGALALSALQFPLRSEAGFGGPEYNWPTPLLYIARAKIDRPSGSLAWAARIGQLIEAAKSIELDARQDAVLRLTFLHEKSLLAQDEQRAFGDALYSQCHEAQFIPTRTNLYPHAFLKLPAPDPEVPRRQFKEILFKVTAPSLMQEEVLAAIAGAARASNNGGPSLVPERSDARRMFDEIVAWRPTISADPFEMDRNAPKRAARQVGPCLALAVIPALEATDITDDRVNHLFQLISEGPVPSALQALPLLVATRPELTDRAAKAIQTAVIGANFDEVGGAIAAINAWCVSSNNGVPLPRAIVDQLLFAIVSRQQVGLANLLWCADRLLDFGLLSEADKSSLADALGYLLLETRYDRVVPPRAMISLSLVRTQCVRLARSLSCAGIGTLAISDWLQLSQSDPLPEVRFALHQQDEVSAA